MPTLDMTKLRAFDLGFTTSQSFVSRSIRVVESFWNWKMWGQEAIPSHMFLCFPVAEVFFAAEMIDPEMSLDTSIQETYINDKKEKLFSFKRFHIFDDPANVQKALNEIVRLKTIGVDYGYDELLKQIGLHEKKSLWLKWMKTDPKKKICSGLANYLVKFLGDQGWGDNPTPEDIWNDPRGQNINAVTA